MKVIEFLKSLFYQQDEIFCDYCNEMKPRKASEHFGVCWICHSCLGEQIGER